MVCLGCLFFFRENAKDLRFDALIEKKVYMYMPPVGGQHSALQLNPRKRDPILGEKKANTPGSCVRPLPRLSPDVVE
jgi:hypothetical protein